MTTGDQAVLSEATWRAILDECPDPILIVDLALSLLFTNRAGQAIVPCGEPAADGLLRALRRQEPALRAATHDGQSIELELDVEGVGAPTCHYELRVSPIAYAPGRAGVLVIARDVSASRRARAELEETNQELERSRRQVLQAQKLESVGRLAGGIAHDFNNLLTSIISFSRFVLDDLAPGDPRRADLIEVLRAADSAARLTRQLLAFSRHRKVVPTVLDLNEAMSSIDRVLRRTVEERVELVTLPSETPMHVSIDPGQLDQVVMNLAVNARDAMPQGGTLTVALEPVAIHKHPTMPRGDYACIKVSDTGTGMSPEVAAHVFEPFFTTKGEKGTGLGLATVYGIVKQADGHVELSSAQGRGTVVRVYLPVTAQLPQPAMGSAGEDAKKKLDGVALVVEDQPAILRTMVRSISGLGFNVLQAHTAEEALALIEELSPKLDLLVSDVMLPGLSGVRLTQRLRERSPGLRVVLCSGYVDQQIDGEVPNDSKTAFLPKPFTGQQLVASASSLFD